MDNESFVNYIISKCEKSSGDASKLRKADNPSLEYQAWEVLGRVGINIEKDFIRIPHILVANMIAKAKAKSNGSMKLGQAIARCYEDGNNSDQASMRLRRILACSDINELALVFRSIYSLIISRGVASLDYARILSQLKSFCYDPDRIKTQWAQEFYYKDIDNQSK